LPNATYVDYLRNDKEQILSKDDFEAFNNNIVFYRILFLYTELSQKRFEGKFVIDAEKFGNVFVHGLFDAYFYDAGYSKEEALSVINEFSKIIEDFTNSLSDNDNESIKKNGFSYCSFTYILNTLSYPGSSNYSTYVALCMNNYRLVKGMLHLFTKDYKIVI
jgi:hypothetical protein